MRAAGVAVALAIVGDRGLPDDLAGARIERDHLGIGGWQENFVLIDGQAARRAVSHGGFRTDVVFPDQVARARVQRLHGVAGVREKHDAVVNDGRGLGGAAIVHGPGPDKLQVLHVRAW